MNEHLRADRAEVQASRERTFAIGERVIVGPNLASKHKPDHEETAWTGVVVRRTHIQTQSGEVVDYGVQPDDGNKNPRSVCASRVNKP